MVGGHALFVTPPSARTRSPPAPSSPPGTAPAPVQRADHRVEALRLRRQPPALAGMRAPAASLDSSQPPPARGSPTAAARPSASAERGCRRDTRQVRSPSPACLWSLRCRPVGVGSSQLIEQPGFGVAGHPVAWSCAEAEGSARHADGRHAASPLKQSPIPGLSHNCARRRPVASASPCCASPN
jgi:hypothetical protein